MRACKVFAFVALFCCGVTAWAADLPVNEVVRLHCLQADGHRPIVIDTFPVCGSIYADLFDKFLPQFQMWVSATYGAYPSTSFTYNQLYFDHCTADVMADSGTYEVGFYIDKPTNANFNFTCSKVDIPSSGGGASFPAGDLGNYDVRYVLALACAWLSVCFGWMAGR